MEVCKIYIDSRVYDGIINLATGCRLSLERPNRLMPQLKRVLWNTGKALTGDDMVWEVRKDILNVLELSKHSNNPKRIFNIAKYVISKNLEHSTNSELLNEAIVNDAFQKLETTHEMIAKLQRHEAVNINAGTFDISLEYTNAPDLITIKVTSDKTGLEMEFVFGERRLPEEQPIFEIIEHPLKIMNWIGRDYRESGFMGRIKTQINGTGVSLEDFFKNYRLIERSLRDSIPLDAVYALQP